MEALFVRRGDGYDPTGIGISPWDARMQTGSALAGLAGQLLDAAPAPVAMTPVRLTIDIYGAVPLAPLTPTIRLLRDGRRIQLAELTLEGEGRTRVRATQLRVRATGAGEGGDPPTRAFPGDGAQAERGRISEMIRIAGDAGTAGPGAMWVRIVTPIVAGEPPSALAQVATVADFGSTIAPPADRRGWTFANVDVSLHLARLPATDWLLVDATSMVGGNGAGMVDMALGDRTGMFGMAHMALYVERRDEEGSGHG